MHREARIALSVLLCLQLLAPAAAGADACKGSGTADCKTTSGPVSMDIGQPSIWSLDQAHYLLTKMHQANSSLHLNELSPDQLDPNKANASRLEVLRTLLQVDAQYDQSVGLKNQIEIQHYREKEARKTMAQIQLQERQEESRKLDQEIQDLNQQIAVLSVQDQSQSPDSPTSSADQERKEKLATLNATLTAKKAQQTALQAEIAKLTETANADVPAPAVTAGSPPDSSGSMTSTATANDSTALKDFVTKTVEQAAAAPTVAASVALDNYLGMQYEIIAKQLTLLRDEAGPDERIVFLELPTSIYTVDKWANNQIAQVKWKVTGIYDERPSPEGICRGLTSSGRTDPQIANTLDLTWERVLNLSRDPANTCLSRVYKAVFRDLLEGLDTSDPDTARFAAQAADDPLSVYSTQDAGSFAEKARSWQVSETKLRALGGSLQESYFTRQQRSGSRGRAEYPITLEMIATGGTLKRLDAGCSQNDLTCKSWKPLRTIDIVPRQSALNINEYQATTNNTGILGVLKLLSGFGAQVNYQRQHEVYQNLLQQEVYASGFGKGSEEFGWTFGPLPGSRRIAPGQRTTYAVLAVPKNAYAIQIEASGWAFPRGASPIKNDRITKSTFLVSIPSEATNRFWADSVSYVTVGKGKTATVLIKGSNFSPQLGVLVNGVTLKKSLSITRVVGDEPALTFPDTGIQGEFELVNSGTLALRFSMGSNFVGTPLITLVTPERTDSINGLPLWVNRQQQSLELLANQEPMFAEEFKVDHALEETDFKTVGSGRKDYDEIQNALGNCKPGKNFVLYRLTGTGLRPNADITVNDIALKFTRLSDITRKDFCPQGQAVTVPQATQETTHSYLLYFEDPGTLKWKVRYRQPTRLSFDEDRFDNVLPAAAGFKAERRNYRFNRSTQEGEADLTLSFPKNLVDHPDVKVSFDLATGQPKPCEPIKVDQNGGYQVHCKIPAEGGERDFVTFTTMAKLKVKVKDPANPGQFIDGTEEKTWLFDQRFPVRPRLEHVQPSASLSSSGQDATLKGVNLHKVTGVLFGDQKADVVVSGDPDQMTVKVPPRVVPAGAREEVPIVFQTDEGAFSTGFTFTYWGPPLPAKPKKARYYGD